MNFQKLISTELQPLYDALSKWCKFLSENKYSNCSELYQNAFD